MRIIMLGGKGISTNIVYNKLSQIYDIEKILIEDPVPLISLLKRRVKNLGLFTVLGQLLFKIIVVKILNWKSKKRIKEILDNNKLDVSENFKNTNKCVRIQSVNSNECEQILHTINPDIVIVNGTRIISKKVLKSTNALFINMHTGITPKYRGVHGGYWAKYKDDDEHCGVTVHLIDEGIDTGDVIYQERIMTNSNDNFCTYPYLQTAAGIPLEIKAINDVKGGKLSPKKIDLPSILYYHPTIFQYVMKFHQKGIK